MGDRETRRTKVARLLEQYDLEGVGRELERRWTADDPEQRRSLRDLAGEFNRRLLRATMADVGRQPLEGEVENTYRLLVEDDVSSAERNRVRRRLEQDGIDVESLLDDFVSYQAVRTYLTKHRDAEHATSDDLHESAEQTLQELRSRVSTVAEDRLTRMRNAGDLMLGDFRVIVDVQVICEDCGSRSSAVEMISDGGCTCKDE